MERTDRVFVARALQVKEEEIAEVISLKQGEIIDNQEVSFSGSCKLTDGTIVDFRGHYDGSWDNITTESILWRGELMDEYVLLLGGTGFNCDFPRVRTAVSLVKLRVATEKTLVTCGMGLQGKQREYQFLAGCALEEGILPQRILTVQSDSVDRNHRNEIRYALQFIQWRSMGDPVRVIIPTEGLLHSWRAKIYAYCQMPENMAAEIECVDTGKKLTWKRRLREMRSFAKCIWWLTWSWKK